MKKAAALGGILAAAALLFVISVLAASEGGEEIVTLTTVESDGSELATRLWIVDDGGFAWLRSGMPDTRWLRQIESIPEVVVERGDEAIRHQAVPVRDSKVRDRIHSLMRNKYGWADRWVSLIRDGTQSVAVRLESP